MVSKVETHLLRFLSVADQHLDLVNKAGHIEKCIPYLL